MMGEKLDVVIFGATGFTGQVVIEKASEYYKELKWGIAGRNQHRLEAVLNKVGVKVSKDLSHIPVIIADVNDEKSIKVMASKCKLIINCCGPYHLYGEVVVRACIEAGTHHIDVSGEPEYIDKMQLKYNHLADERSVYIISSCGFESIPAEMGVQYIDKKFPGIINSIECYLETNIHFKDPNNRVVLNTGTWESAIYAMKNFITSLKCTLQLNSSYLPKVSPTLWPSLLPKRIEHSSKYFTLFPLTDRLVVKRSQRILYELNTKRPIQFEMYKSVNSLALICLLPFYLMFLTMLSFITFTRNLLLKYPKLFTMGFVSHKGPSEDNKKNMRAKLLFVAKGWSKGRPLKETTDLELQYCIECSDPFYGFTAYALLSAAKIILNEKLNMPKNGGVLTPGAAFAKTSLMDELQSDSIGLTVKVLN